MTAAGRRLRGARASGTSARVREALFTAGPYVVAAPFLVWWLAMWVDGVRRVLGIGAIVAAAVLVARHERRPESRPLVLGFWCAAALATGTWMVAFEGAVSEAHVAVAGATTAACHLAWSRGRRNVAVALLLAVAAAPVLRASSVALGTAYAVAAAVVAWALRAPVGDGRPALVLGTAALAWLAHWWGYAFYVAPRFDLRGHVLAQPGLADAVPPGQQRELVSARARWLAASCDGGYLVAANQSRLWVARRAGGALEDVVLPAVPPGFSLHLLDTVLHECEHDRLLVPLEKPRLGFVVLDGAYPPRVRLEGGERAGSARRAWLDERGTRWFYTDRGAASGFAGRMALDRFSADGRLLASVPVLGPFRCVLPLGGASLLFEDERVLHRPRPAPAGLPLLLDPLTTTCAHLPERDELVVPGYIRGGVWWHSFTAAAGSRVPIGRGIRAAYRVGSGDRLLLLDYFSGALHVVDAGTRTPLARWDLGPRARKLSFSSDGARAYAVSAAGAWEIDVGRLLGGAAAGREGRASVRRGVVVETARGTDAAARRGPAGRGSAAEGRTS